MSAEVRDFSSQVKLTIKQRLSLALRFILDDVDKTADPKTPKRRGDLRNQKRKQVLGLHAAIAWQRAYAPVQELKQFGNYTTPGTGPHFAENAVKEVIGRAERHFRKAGL